MSSTSNNPILARMRRANPTMLKRWVKQGAKSGLARTGYHITRLDDEGSRYVKITHNEETPLPPGAEEHLRRDNPELLQMERAYEALDIPATAHTQWRSSFLRKNLSMAWFRGDNAYVWQFRLLRTAADVRMYLSLLDIESRDRLSLLKRLKEDSMFGAWVFRFGDRAPVSRDLLDSVNEINYLDARMSISQIEDLKVLDIGAGYGRLAHRMSSVLPNLAAYDCIDGVAVSTFLCEYYLKIREVPDSIRVVRLDEHETLADDYDLVVNIHSFAECSLDAIRWWLDRIAERRIEWLLIVPNNPPELLSTEIDGTKREFMSDVLSAGYELVDSRPMCESDELRELIDLHGKFYLFRRTPS